MLGLPFWITSYLGANFALIAVVVLAVVALGALAWFAKNWKVAAAAVCVLVAGLAYQQIDKNAYQRRVSEEAAQQVAVLQGRLDTLSDINNAAAARAIQDEVKIETLRSMARDTPANNAPCLDEEATKRVGTIK